MVKARRLPRNRGIRQESSLIRSPTTLVSKCSTTRLKFPGEIIEHQMLLYTFCSPLGLPLAGIGRRDWTKIFAEGAKDLILDIKFCRCLLKCNMPV